MEYGQSLGDMYYRNFEGLDEVRRGSFVELSGRLLQKNRSDSAAFSRPTSDRYVMSSMSAGVTEPVETDCDVKRISFVNKANEIFQRPAGPTNSRSEPSIQKIPSTMEKQRKISTQTSGAWPPVYFQPPDTPPRFEQADLVPQQPTKREAELESAVKILSMKLDYTQRKIMESQNNKEILKAKLDHLIENLTKAGYDPNLKPQIKYALKSISTKLDNTERKIVDSQNRKDILKAKLDHFIKKLTQAGFDPNLKVGNRPMSGPNDGRRSPTTNERGAKYSPRMSPKGAELYRDTPQHAGQVQAYRPDQRKISNTSWEKLRELADEYERRLMLIRSLEEQEKYVKSQMTTPVNITVPSIMGAPRPNLEHPR